MPEFKSLPGFRDFYPADFAVRAHIVSTWRETAHRYAFEEYDGPPLEPLELYTEKSGEEIVAQLYSFTDKGDRQVALRPEMTPTLARMIGARAGGMAKPIRWFSTPQLFRYERAQRGRLREHFQWNVDIVGEEDIAADAEVLSVALDALQAFGLTADDVVARVSDRRLMERVLLSLGVAADRLPAVYAVIDKLEREERARTRTRLLEGAGLEAAVADRILSLFDDGALDTLAGSFAGRPGVDDEVARMRRYLGYLHDAGFGDFVTFDARIVRGLAYYTGTVFEIFDRRGELRAICGGGRYDDLLARVSASDLPAVGFGMGDVVLAELLEERGLLPDVRPTVDYFIVAIGDEQHPMVRRVARALRASGASVVYSLRPTGVGRQFKEAGGRGARHTVVLGPEEVARGEAVVKEMDSGQERRVPLVDLGVA
ncbi:MAG TPA: histidine--tRNA ligase [Longimicrobiales bacterium]|nr:histidine--tRNA ligase [Longimicrobiales bacterium]